MILTIFSIFVCLILLVFTIILYKLWLRPIQLQHMLRSQGLKGPSYKFIYGNIKEIKSMRNEAIKAPLDLQNHDMLPRIMPHVHAWTKLYGQNFLTWISFMPQVYITEPELVKEILINKEGVYRKIRPTGFVKKLLGDGLGLTDGEKWLKLRKIANHAFHAESLKDMFPAMVASVDAMLEKWSYDEGNEIEVSKEFKLLTSEVISRTAFGSSYVEGKNIFEMLEKLGAIVARNVYKIPLFGLEKLLRSKDAIESEKIDQSLCNSILSLVRKREEMVKTGEAESFGSDYFGSLLKVHHDPDPNSRISIDDIIDQCKTFYVAGHETTSNLLPWVVFLLSVHTDWQEKAREEVLQLFGRQNPTAEGVGRMKILTMIINEALRLYGPVADILRMVHKKTRLGKYEIPANAIVYVTPLALHSNTDIWGEDAHLFKPDRFAEGLAKATNGNPVAFLPFGFGPRMCVGLNFASNEAKIALSMILQRYKFSLSPNYVHSPIQLLTVGPQNGVQIVLRPL